MPTSTRASKGKSAKPRNVSTRSKPLPCVTVDAENDIETGRFLCGSWYDGKSLIGTHDLSTYADAWQSLPSDVVLRGHNISWDIRKALSWDVSLPQNFTIEDSLIGARFLFPLYPEKKLDFLAKLDGYVYRDVHGEGSPESNLDGCGKSAYTTHQLCDTYNRIAKERGQLIHLQTYYKIAQAFIALEVAGLKVDTALLQEEQSDATQRLIELSGLVPDAAMDTNDGVLRQWLALHYTPEQLKILPVSRKSGKTAISKKHLGLLQPQRPEFEPIIEYRELHRYKTVFLDNVLKAVSPRGFIFPSYKLLVARTQRRSSTPNIQNWPDKARRNVISRFLDGQIVTRDFANLEARIFAWQAGCDDFLNALIEGGYIAVASQCLGITIKDKSDPRYKQVKSTVLAVTYNMGTGLFAYREFLNSGGKKRMTKDEAQAHYDVLFNRYPEIHTEMERRKSHAWKHGCTLSNVGVPLQLPIIPDDLLPDNPQWVENYRKKVENWSINWPTQSMAAYITGCALWDLQNHLADVHGGWGSYLSDLHETTQVPNTKRGYNEIAPVVPINEVHDALGVDSTAATVEYASEVMDYYMCAGKTLLTLAPQFDINILATEAKVASRWDGELEEAEL